MVLLQFKTLIGEMFDFLEERESFQFSFAELAEFVDSKRGSGSREAQLMNREITGKFIEMLEACTFIQCTCEYTVTS